MWFEILYVLYFHNVSLIGYRYLSELFCSCFFFHATLLNKANRQITFNHPYQDIYYMDVIKKFASLSMPK